MEQRPKRRYLVVFAQIHEDFRIQELIALAAFEGINLRFDPAAYAAESPLHIVELDSDDQATRLVRRAALVKGIYELWDSAPNYVDLCRQIAAQPERYRKHEEDSFRFHVHAFGKKQSLATQQTIMQRFFFMQLHGSVDLSNPSTTFAIFEDHTPPHRTASERVPAAGEPCCVYFGRLVSCGGRHAVTVLSLKKRAYLGTTSMDAELALLMANQAGAGPGKLVYDPFVGTGGILVAAAYVGAYTIGSDYDARVLRGRTPGCNVQANVSQYALERVHLDLGIYDLARHPWRHGRSLLRSGAEEGTFDAIITDPPYGVRAGVHSISDLAPGGVEQIVPELLATAAHLLVHRGRLVFMLPVGDDDASLPAPTHPCLRLIATSVQSFGHWSRRLLTYVRLGDDESAVALDEREGAGQSSIRAPSNFRRKYFKMLL